MDIKWFVTGDIHGRLNRFDNFPTNENCAIIIAGDAGFNYYGGKKDKQMKMVAGLYKCRFYCVRGNHEARPQNVKGMMTMYDVEVEGTVYFEPDYPYIRYFRDGEIYTINGYRTLVVGGAFSVDKEFRLMMKYTWFEDEQLNADEMAAIEEKVRGQEFDLVLAHTCPYEWMPRDKFLSFIDQSKVDNSMEFFLSRLLNECKCKTFICGHFHDDRQLAPGAFMVYEDIKELEWFM